MVKAKVLKTVFKWSRKYYFLVLIILLMFSYRIYVWATEQKMAVGDAESIVVSEIFWLILAGLISTVIYAIGKWYLKVAKK